MNVLKRERGETGKEYALRVIRDNIVSLELAPGENLDINVLAEKLGLSRTPVREAISELEKIGIVEVYPQRGSKVSRIDLEMVDSARFLRNSLECSAVRECCRCRTEEDLIRIEENASLQELYYQQHLKKNFLEIDDQFHKLIFTIANKLPVYYIIKTYSIHFDRIRTVSLNVVKTKDSETLDDHKRIVQAIKDQNADLAAEYMDLHLTRYKIDLETIYRECPEYFKQAVSG